ncbi:unnamed protein product [Effrenium voratum]|nr:unnamed protein product [Effrenium voratum]
MCIGSRSRGFELSSSKDGIGFAGVGKHCVLERQVDSSDKVLIVLEISEVEQEERSSSTICLRTRHDLAGSGFPSSVQQKRRVPAPFEASVRCSARPSTATDLRRGSSAGARSAGLAIVGDTSWSRLPLKG